MSLKRRRWSLSIRSPKQLSGWSKISCEGGSRWRSAAIRESLRRAFFAKAVYRMLNSQNFTCTFVLCLCDYSVLVFLCYWESINKIILQGVRGRLVSDAKRNITGRGISPAFVSTFNFTKHACPTHDIQCTIIVLIL